MTRAEGSWSCARPIDFSAGLRRRCGEVIEERGVGAWRHQQRESVPLRARDGPWRRAGPPWRARVRMASGTAPPAEIALRPGGHQAEQGEAREVSRVKDGVVEGGMRRFSMPIRRGGHGGRSTGGLPGPAGRGRPAAMAEIGVTGRV